MIHIVPALRSTFSRRFFNPPLSTMVSAGAIPLLEIAMLSAAAVTESSVACAWRTAFVMHSLMASTNTGQSVSVPWRVTLRFIDAAICIRLSIGLPEGSGSLRAFKSLNGLSPLSDHMVKIRRTVFKEYFGL